MLTNKTRVRDGRGRPRKKALEARKVPGQARSQETVSVILEPSARILESDGPRDFNPNAIAVKAGISVGSVRLENVEISEETRVIAVSFSVPNAAFSYDSLRHPIFGLSFARGARAGELGSAPPNRHPSAVPDKTPEIDPVGALVVGVGLPRLERLALGVSHRPTRNRSCLASCRRYLFWTWKVRRGQRGRSLIPREIRDLIRKTCRENPGWGAPRLRGELLKLGQDQGNRSH